MTYFVPRDDNLLAILVELTNNTDKIRDLSLFAQVEWNIGDATKKVAHPSDGVGGSQANLYKSVDMDGNIMYAHTNNWRSTARCEPWPFVGYLSSSTRVSAYETSGGKFFGPKRNWYAPQAIQTGKLTNTPFRNYDEFPFGVLKSNVRMAPGETKKVTFLLGMELSRDLVKQKVAKYNALKYTQDQLQNVKDFYRDFLSNTLTINTPDKANDRIINIWSQYHWRQFLKKDLDTEAHGSAFWAYGLEGSTLWFHPELTLVGLDMQLVKKSLISILLSNQVPDPTNVNIFMGPDAMLDKDIDKQ